MCLIFTHIKLHKKDAIKRLKEDQGSKELLAKHHPLLTAFIPEASVKDKKLVPKTPRQSISSTADPTSCWFHRIWALVMDCRSCSGYLPTCSVRGLAHSCMLLYLKREREKKRCSCPQPPSDTAHASCCCSMLTYSSELVLKDIFRVI